ncbi:Fur2 [Clostridium kluyveri DSM 555]|uniref:Fur2 n=1 Tax=Clostridium kluyveri (strain ATCC 8527 / DSM 555 / NBRC 12016 / NCIMB 10680 / K1) TaxID=431943 RepID=A5N5V3_CLOK5|nr:transcriptional repressor [Clostridium kluyveri]EDK32684.1 Fur2 [Clostridium kluyveri DSM 555]
MLYKKLIKNKGYEFTIQKRILLLEMINANTHLSVKQIYERIKDKNIGLATVYRSLKIFGELGIVKKINVDNINYYEIKIFSGKPLHVHFKCDKCNSIIDVDNLEQDLSYIKLNKKIEEKNDVEIYDVDIMLKGLCSKCKGG